MDLHWMLAGTTWIAALCAVGLAIHARKLRRQEDRIASLERRIFHLENDGR